LAGEFVGNEKRNIVMLPINVFKTVIEATPLISIDLIVRNDQQKILLGKRTNRPAQGFWFVPGGRVLKDESLEAAFKRILTAELGITFNSKNLVSKFQGVYQHFYDDNAIDYNFTTHYVVLAYELQTDCSLSLLPKDQHDSYKWLSEIELLKDNSVHKHTKWYFKKGQSADASFMK
jgi:colanic acid biosynthesis protein WcaH